MKEFLRSFTRLRHGWDSDNNEYDEYDDDDDDDDDVLKRTEII